MTTSIHGIGNAGTSIAVGIAAGQHLTVDVRADLWAAQHPTLYGLYRLRDLFHVGCGDPIPSAVIDGVTVTGDEADDLICEWLAACGRAWIAQAEALGHTAIELEYGDPTAGPWTDDELAAWQQVWDTVQLPTLAEVQR